jgi:hypothetical protein
MRVMSHSWGQQRAGVAAVDRADEAIVKSYLFENRVTPAEGR